MEKATTVRFDLTLPTTQRAALAALANEIGVSSADLVRMSLRYTLANRELFLRPSNHNQGEAR
jgi:hypothetical protein